MGVVWVGVWGTYEDFWGEDFAGGFLVVAEFAEFADYVAEDAHEDYGEDELEEADAPEGGFWDYGCHFGVWFLW